MYDTSTVAFDIKYPWPSQPPSKLWPKGYHSTFVTIWHEDPALACDHGNRSDDSCGWFRPPCPPAERERARELGRSDYSTIWSRQRAIAEGASYASVCIDQDCYGAVYWAWRRIKQELHPRGRWNWGERRNFLTAGELEEIYSLAWNPVDNLQVSYRGVKDAEGAGKFYLTVWRCFQRHHRPWWQHPRWHFWHWRFQIHPLQQLRRFLFDRCSTCGKGFAWGESPVSNGASRDSGHQKLWHMDCDRANAAVMPNSATGTWDAAQ